MNLQHGVLKKFFSLLVSPGSEKCMDCIKVNLPFPEYFLIATLYSILCLNGYCFLAFSNGWKRQIRDAHVQHQIDFVFPFW